VFIIVSLLPHASLPAMQGTRHHSTGKFSQGFTPDEALIFLVSFKMTASMNSGSSDQFQILP